jgi:hypothetical protein
MEKMIRRSLVCALTVALAACASPGTHPQPTDPSPSAAKPVVTVTTAGLAKSEGTADLFPALPSGYRGIGGVLVHAGTTNIITPDMSAPQQKHDLDVGLLHGMAVGGYSEETTSVRPADCLGTGETPQSAIKVQGLKDPPVEETASGIACARLLHPGTHWLMSQAIAGDQGYFSQVVLGDGSGTTVIVYTDINRMANQLIQELGG